MPRGPGKYGAHAERLLEEERADAVMVAVVGGRAGSGFTVALVDQVANNTTQLELVRILRKIADALEADVEIGEESN